MEPPNNGHIGDEHFVHCSEVVPCMNNMQGANNVSNYREVVHSSECPLSEVPLYDLYCIYKLGIIFNDRQSSGS